MGGEAQEELEDMEAVAKRLESLLCSLGSLGDLGSGRRFDLTPYLWTICCEVGSIAEALGFDFETALRYVPVSAAGLAETLGVDRDSVERLLDSMRVVGILRSTATNLLYMFTLSGGRVRVEAHTEEEVRRMVCSERGW